MKLSITEAFRKSSRVVIRDQLTTKKMDLFILFYFVSQCPGFSQAFGDEELNNFETE